MDFKDFKEVVLKNRSYRRFDGRHQVQGKTLNDLIDLARFTPSGANFQPLKFVLSNSPEWNAKIFDTLAWAGYLQDWDGPVESERPTAYVIILLDKRIQESAPMDAGISAQTILLGAASMGLGGCMVGNTRKAELAEILELPDHVEILLAIALGKPVERVELEDTPPGGSIKYYRDSSATHHVPKRTREELVLKSFLT